MGVTEPYYLIVMALMKWSLGLHSSALTKETLNFPVLQSFMCISFMYGPVNCSERNYILNLKMCIIVPTTQFPLSMIMKRPQITYMG